MRVIDIAIFMLVFQVMGAAVVGFLPYMGLEGDIFVMHQDTDTEIQNYQNKVEDVVENYQSSAESGDPLSTAFGMFYNWMMSAIGNIVDSAMPILKYVAWMPLLMQQMGVPALIAWPFFTIFTVLEAFGFMQLIAGRNVKEYD